MPMWAISRAALEGIYPHHVSVRAENRPEAIERAIAVIEAEVRNAQGDLTYVEAESRIAMLRSAVAKGLFRVEDKVPGGFTPERVLEEGSRFRGPDGREYEVIRRPEPEDFSVPRTRILWQGPVEVGSVVKDNWMLRYEVVSVLRRGRDSDKAIVTLLPLEQLNDKTIEVVYSPDA